MTKLPRPALRIVSLEQRRLLLSPLLAFLVTLLVLWTLTVLMIRTMEGLDPSLRQFLPILLWSAAILAWVRWQKIAQPRGRFGLALPTARAFGAALAAFAIVLGWNILRVSLARTPGGILGALPAEIYLWLLVGVFLNEVLLRGVVLSRLVEVYDPAIAIPLTALIGVLFRIPALFTTAIPIPFDPVMLLGVFVFGCIAGLLRHYTRSLWPAIALQWGNALGSLV